MLTDYYNNITIERKTQTTGFGSSTYIAVSGSYKGFIQPLSGDEMFTQGKSADVSTHRLYTPITTPIQHLDKITQSGQSYIVMHAIQPNGISAVLHHKEILLRVVE